MASVSTPSDLHIANDLRLAADDLSAARLLWRADNRNDAYHVQQAAEKILLALLTSEGVYVERKDSHRLDVLRDKLPKDNPFKDRFNGLTQLTLYATTFRYPRTAGRIPQRANKSDLEKFIEKIDRILNDAASHFEVDLGASDHVPAKNIQPPRNANDRQS